MTEAPEELINILITVLISASKKLQRIVDIMLNCSKNPGLEMNFTKTRLMVLSKNHNYNVTSTTKESSNISAPGVTDIWDCGTEINIPPVWK